MMSGLFCTVESSFNQLPWHLDSHSLHWHVCHFFPEWHNSLVIWILLSGFLCYVFSFLGNGVLQCHSSISQIRPVCNYPSRLSSSNASPEDASLSFSPPRGFSLRTHSHLLALTLLRSHWSCVCCWPFHLDCGFERRDDVLVAVNSFI